MKNLLVLNFERGWRGGERQTVYALQGFNTVGISTRLICRKGSPLELAARREGFAVNAFNSVFGVIFFLITKGGKFDGIHAQTSHILTYCVFTKFFHRSKVIFTRRVNFKQKGYFTKLKYRFTDKIVVISEPIQQSVAAFCGRNDIELISDVVLQNEPNQELIASRCAKLPIGNRHIIGTTSALTGEKDPYTMIDAIKKLSEIRKDFIFLHFGAGDLQESIQKKIEENGLEQVYFLMGFEKNMEAVFPIFEVFIVTSKEEGLGSSVLDAFMHKVPVVSTNAGGLKNLLRDQRGISCEVGDSAAIAAGIAQMLDIDAKKKVYIDNGFNYASRYHSMEFITDKYLILFENLLATN